MQQNVSPQYQCRQTCLFLANNPRQYVLNFHTFYCCVLPHLRAILGHQNSFGTMRFLQQCSYAMSAPNLVCRRHNGFILFICAYVDPCVRLETLLTRYLAQYLTHFHHTYDNDALWDSSEHVTIGVKDQGHDGIKYTGNWAC